VFFHASQPDNCRKNFLDCFDFSYGRFSEGEIHQSYVAAIGVAAQKNRLCLLCRRTYGSSFFIRNGKAGGISGGQSFHLVLFERIAMNPFRSLMDWIASIRELSETNREINAKLRNTFHLDDEQPTQQIDDPDRQIKPSPRKAVRVS
jgi:hypothetical protein